MSEMIEKMAKAFAADIERQYEEGKPGPYIDTDYGMNDVVIDGRVDLLAAMRAAIAEMSQPTEAMHIASDLPGISWEENGPIDVWQAMIAAALRKG